MALGITYTFPSSKLRLPYIQRPAFSPQAKYSVANSLLKGRRRYFSRVFFPSPQWAVEWLWQIRTGTPARQAAKRANTDIVDRWACTTA